ncbi:MAG TPA: hypothetical protein VM689_11470 [Aliidongia sp.]|nr:hypothetical protein [Aliidongia sp.]
MKKICIAAALCLLTLLPRLAATQAQAQLYCSGGTKACFAGDEGKGGCYSPSASFCTDGRICPVNTKVCTKGPFGPGGCYNQQTSQCIKGQVFYTLPSSNGKAQ